MSFVGVSIKTFCTTLLNSTLFWDVGSGYGKEFD